MTEYIGSCHCGSVSFKFTGPAIEKGVRCNCSICRRKGAIMSAFTIAPEEIKIDVKDNALATYEFGSRVAKHHFCKKCGIYPFHQTLRKPGHYRVNVGCVDGVDSLSLPVDVFDGASI
ncbi:MAG: GFA family protein [Pseudomonadota bacterium]|nr:MAG: GFA family protein [Pseudomonadota bacterium]